MKASKTIALCSFTLAGAIAVTACESTETSMPIPKRLLESNAGASKGKTGREQLTLPQASTPIQAEVSREIPLKFDDLDFDNNGSIDRQEASNIPDLKQKWWRLDQNTDGRLDQAEFSRFEQDPVDRDSLSR